MTEREYYTREYQSGGSSTFYIDGGKEVHVGFSSYPADLKRCRVATAEEIKEFEAEEKRREAVRRERAEQDRIEAERLSAIYGFDPRQVGNRPRGFWEEDGQLIICARDGGSNEPDCNAGAYGNFVGTDQDGFDCTYRYYRYEPITESTGEGQ